MADQRQIEQNDIQQSILSDSQNANNQPDGSQYQSSQYREPIMNRRSRTNTHQDYQQDSPAMQPAMPLMPQHSGMNQGAGPSGSRPQSRGAGLNAGVLHPGFVPQPLPTRPGTSSGQSTQPKSPFTAAVTAAPRNRPSQILLINPTSNSQLTMTMLNSLKPILPSQLEIIGYTAPYPAPTATETQVDMALSSEIVVRDLAKYATNNGETVKNFDALLVASFTAHPLITALRESYDVPVVGILEGSLYVSRMLGARFGILATTNRHRVQQTDAVQALGLSHFFSGSEAVHFSPAEVLSLSTQSQLPDDLTQRIKHAARTLVAKGADTLIMGSESFSSNEVIRAAKDAVRDEDGRRTVNVVDCVEAGVMCLNALVGMGVPTSKKGLYRGEREGRRARGQTWL
ncbi:hypothetical protein BT93_L4460 [Corymbia citriodora subsp. variegata]|uniref:Uncharacterized protein n=1 Tax=Corymbia citriodora subsp. variegata TaxID=360336 RepID=A0A8T0CFU8_CORYI|nr:hypothetical protein BT93_L4460 [Corymbia citriodora subsp. variegata]